MEPAGEKQEACAQCQLARPPGGWPEDPHVGRVVNNKYELIQLLGSGGFGTVVRGRHVHGEGDLGDVVLKFLHTEKALSKSIKKRFFNEARAARSLQSPHVVKVYDYDYDGTTPFIVMEYLEGPRLEDLLERAPLPPERVLNIALQITGTLQQCHEAGIIHRDLKPANIMLLSAPEPDFVKILDFGIAHLPGGQQTRSSLGTPRYMPPEQYGQGEGEELDGRVDIYALGVILHRCFTGELPDESFMGGKRPPAELSALLASMMDEDRDDRPGTMADVELRLRAVARAQGWLAGAAVDDDRTVDGPREARTVEPEEPEAEAASKEVDPYDETALALDTPAPRPAPAPVRRVWPWFLLGGGLLVLGLALGSRVQHPSAGEIPRATPAARPTSPDTRPPDQSAPPAADQGVADLAPAGPDVKRRPKARPRRPVKRREKKVTPPPAHNKVIKKPAPDSGAVYRPKGLDWERMRLKMLQGKNRP